MSFDLGGHESSVDHDSRSFRNIFQRKDSGLMFRQVLDDPVGVLLSAVELAPVLVALAFIRPIRSLAFLGAVRSILASGKKFNKVV